MIYNVLIHQRLTCGYNDSVLVATQIVALPAPPHYGLIIEADLENSMFSQIALERDACQIVFNRTKDAYRIHFKDLPIATEEEMLDHVERYEFHGWKVEVEGAKIETVSETSGYHRKKKKNPFTLIDGGKKDKELNDD